MIDENPLDAIKRALIKLHVPSDVARIITDLALVHARPEARPASGPAHIGEIARSFRKSSVGRSETLGVPVVDASWHMLLALVEDAHIDRPSSVSSLCHASGAPQTTALRHIEKLERGGLIARRNDEGDARRSFVAATPTVLTKMEQIIRSFCVSFPDQ